MAATIQHRIRGRPAHTPGPTFLTYTPDGRRLITAGSNNSVRVYTTGSDGEPTNVDDCQESNTAVVATDDFFITGSEDGTVSMYSLQSNTLEKMLLRCTLPIRDIALSPDGNWAAVASDELVVKVVNTQDMTRVLYLREQSKPVKHLSFDPSGTYIALSCSDGVIFVYSLSTEEPALVKKVDGLIRNLETDAEASSRVAWHPDGRAFAAPTPTKDIQVMSNSDWERQRAFSSGHAGDITAFAWSPNGALLASAGTDRKVLLWDCKTQRVIARFDYPNVMAIAWHPTQNLMSFTTSDGEVFMYNDIVPSEYMSLLKKGVQPAPFIHDPLAETLANGNSNGIGQKEGLRRRYGTPDSLDDILGSEGGGDEDDFIVDDDGAGYAERAEFPLKRPYDDYETEPAYAPLAKRTAYEHYRPRMHTPFQVGSTPWRGNRKYLCLNLIGFVWTVDQETHHTVTVEFYDRELHRDFHFTDPYRYDKACLNDNGALFSCSPTDGNPAMIFYRPHETWTTRADWRTTLPPQEHITAIALSDSYIFVSTTANYLRVYTLFGTPFRVFRQKSSPTVTCASWRDYVMTMGNGPVGGDGCTRLMYTIENVKRGEVCQSEDVVALPPNAELRSVFFSDRGDPCIYDSTGVLLVLLHWRTPGQAQWAPILDTKQLERLASGRKEETYWPVAVAADKFHCIILKGGDKYPYFPRPLLSEFDLKIPISSLPAATADDENSSANDGPRLEETFVRTSVELNLMEDLVNATAATHSQRTELARKEVDVDKALLQLLAIECRESEDKGMKALEIVELMRDQTGRMLEAAEKVAARFQRNMLAEKIRELAERRLAGLEDED
ncbi:WD40 repeat-like protein [Xylona heveae TC161]|uniref:WD40 repeat-like protein n=1 Tax=Xylona heveae (strain CBS 132557 / TC161) TaxID=1328760 RepID=A0A165AK15_XYLHT|nr:WD40 repeat-like protein [Xylona heveae TC161]KZF20612.1 WD40 repeat-like protein [Xylona heveae TC161]